MPKSIAQSCNLRKHQRADGLRDDQGMAASENFSANIARIIERRGLTINGAARSWKVPTKTLEAIVKRWRTPSLETAERIADAAGYHLWQLLAFDFDPDNPPVLRAVSGVEAELYEKLKLLARQVPTPDK